MLYSERKERENRFKLTLKITFPFLILSIIAFLFISRDESIDYIFYLFLALIIIQAYYTLYLIYVGFRGNLLDRATKAYTREKILEVMQKNISKKNSNCYIVLVNIENLDDLNERYGISTNDSTLRSFALYLNQFLSDYNFKKLKIGYYGNGNFIFGIESKKEVLDHIFNQFSQNLKNSIIEDKDIKTNIEMIESSYDKDINNIVKKLIVEIECKKRECKNERFIIKPNEFEEVVCRTIDDRSLSFRFQPIMSLESNNIEIYEVLIKLDSKKHGLIPQHQFIPMVNRIGYEEKFDLILVEEILKIIKKIPNSNAIFSFNLSPFSIRKNNFRVKLLELFSKYEVNPNRIIIELFERRVYRDRKRYNDIILDYKNSGINIALDNFGGNNASVEYIKDLEFNFIKLDLELTKNIFDLRYKKLLEGYMGLFKALNVKTIMKFIDNDEILEEAKELEIDFVQGYQISRPITIEQLLKDNS